MESTRELLNKLDSRLNKLDSRLNKLDSSIDKLDSRLNNIEQLMNNNNKECIKMGNHIDFIDTIYENVKHPLGYICNNVKYYMGDKKINYNLEN